MLTEIICDKFKETNQKIIFHPGLNVVLGGDKASNSIGKSTFLMIIDFVFGGNDYIGKCDDVHRMIKSHKFKFAFSFDSKFYHFIRGTDDSNFVSECDSHYNIQNTITIDEFKRFLKKHYNITTDDLSFRDTISGYFRIYQRKNYNEYRPFQSFEGEAAENSIIRLIKLYNLYDSIKEYEKTLKENIETLSIYKKSLDKGFIPKINKRQYESDKKEIDKTDEEITSIAYDLDRNILDVENLKTKEVRELKEKISVIKASRTKYENKKEKLQFEITDNDTPKISNSDFYKSLKQFFPNVNERELSEVDNFHKGIYRILNKEVKSEIDRLNNLIEECNIELLRLNQLLDSYQEEKNLSKFVLKKIEACVVHKNELIAEISSYDKLKAYEEDKKQNEKRLAEEIKNILLQLQTKINSEVENLNKQLYSPKIHQPPMLSLSQKNYEYKSMDDNGTGTNYKNLIILDMCLLKQTQLPAIIHDSLLFKNISDELLEKIFAQYINYEKQIFIAFDRLATYSEGIQNLLKNKRVLQLGDGKEALFGFTWGDRTNKESVK